VGVLDVESAVAVAPASYEMNAAPKPVSVGVNVVPLPASVLSAHGGDIFDGADLLLQPCEKQQRRRHTNVQAPVMRGAGRGRDIF
jgi:hypothetical protein